VDALKIGATPDELSVMSAGLFQEYGQDLSDAGIVEVALLSF
jgi:hypothetical protein